MTKSNSGLKILKLTTANVKKLVAVQITPDGKEVILTGKNESGKSSVIDSIFLCINFAAATRSKDGKRNIENIIRKGETAAVVTVELDSLIITRKFIGDKTYLDVRDADGRPFQRPQKILDDLVDAIAFDPLEFAAMHATKQAEVLSDLAGIDTSVMETKRDEAYESRTLAGRDLTNEKARLDALEYDYDAPDNEVSAVELTKELTEYHSMLARNGKLHENADHAREMHNDADLALNEAKDDLALAKERAELAETRFKETLDDSKKAGSAKPEVWKGTADIEQAVNNVEDINARVRSNAEYSEAAESCKKYQKAYDKTDSALTKARDAIISALSKAKYPLKGLTVEDSQVYMDGTIFQDLSDGRKLLVSTAIGMALNPKLRCIFMRNASLLDKENLKAIRDLANGKDYQLWIEAVHTDEPSAVHMVDGRIKGQQIEVDLPIPKTDK